MRALFSPLVPLMVWAFLLPLQTRYFLWQPELGGGVVEYGVISLYLVPLGCFAWFMGSSWLWGDIGQRAGEAQPLRRPGWLAGAGVFIIFYWLLSCWLAVDWQLAMGITVNVLTASLVIMTLLDRRVVLEPVLLAFALGLLPSVLLGMYQVIFDTSPASTLLGLAARDAEHLGDAVLLMGEKRELRAYGFFPHPNIFGGYLAVALVGIAYLWSQSRRFFYGALFGGLLMGILLTASRSATLGLACGLFSLITFFYCAPKYRGLTTLFTLLVTGGLFIGLFAMPGVLSGLRGGGELEQRSVSERVAGIVDLPRSSPARVFFGAGPGNTAIVLHGAHPNWEAWRLQPPHVVGLVIFLEFGLLGVGLLIVGFCYGITLLYRRFLPEDRLYLAWLHVLIPIAVFDHYLVTLYSGIVLVGLVWVFAWRGRMM